MSSVMSTIMSGLSGVNLWGVISIVISFVCSITGIAIGFYLIWRFLNYRFDTRFHKRYVKRHIRGF